jgi:hypothetical protein
MFASDADLLLLLACTLRSERSGQIKQQQC